jgi:formiminoglutamase
MTANDPHWPRASDWLARDDPDPRLAVVGLPTSSASLSPSQAWETPAALRRMLARFSTFDGETGTELLELTVADRGDWTIAHLAPDEMVAAVTEATAALPSGPVHAFLGGDNLVTYPVVAGLPQAPLERIGVLTLDAHHDVRTTEHGLTNGAPIRALVEAGLPGGHVVQVGIHSFANSAHYRHWADEQGIRVATMGMVDEHGVDRVVADGLDYLAERCDVIHVDVDVDVLDRAHAPACPGARPGGMTPRQLAAAARRCGRHPAVVSADFVEVDATRDLHGTTVMAMATAFLAFASGVGQREG